MAYHGHLKLHDIRGESQHADHEDEIQIHGIAWQVTQAASSSAGAGRTRRRADISPFVVYKFYDASSPYLALAAMRGTNLLDAVISLMSPGERSEDYLRITLTNCSVASYEILPPEDEELHIQSSRRRRANVGPALERLSIAFERVRVHYTESRPDGSGAEHEIEYDISAGA